MKEQHKCKICGKEFKNSRGRNIHIRFKHPEISIEEYYYKYYPRHCKVCKKLISFKGEKYLQSVYCSMKCMSKDFSERKDFKTFNVKKKYKKDFLLQQLKNLHIKYKGYVTQQMVKENTELSFQLYHSYFGSFTEACKLANVPNLGQHNSRKHFKKDVIKKIKETFEKTKIKINWKLLFKHTDLTKQSVYQFFSSLGDACEEANVPYHLEDKIKGKQINNMLKIIIDSNEKKPYNFKNCVFKRLNFGDYKSANFYNGVVFERKSKNDLKSTMSGGKSTKRFAKVMERARDKNAYVLIIIDCTKDDFFSTPTYGRMSNRAIYHNIKKFGSIYADICQFVFTGSRSNSKKIIEFCFNWRPIDLININFQDLMGSCDDKQYDMFSDLYIYDDNNMYWKRN